MAAGLLLCQGKRMNDKEKAERLAAKLRENLRRRKAQARAARSYSPLGEVVPRSGDGGVSGAQHPSVGVADISPKGE